MSYNEIDINAYAEQLANAEGSEHVLIDVREADEFAAGRLPNAINIPLSQWQMRYNEVPQDQMVVLVCGHGSRSAQAAEFLVYQGYNGDQLHNLIGGTFGWMMAGYPLEQE